MASICTYSKMLFGSLFEKDWVKNMKIHSSLNSDILLWKKTVITLFFFYEKVPLCPNYDLILLMILTSILQILRKDKNLHKLEVHLFFSFSSYLLEAWKSSKLSCSANSWAFSLNMGPFIGIFSLRIISNHFMTALLTASYFSGLTLVAPSPLS